jgi:hypothetical protein
MPPPLPYCDERETVGNGLMRKKKHGGGRGLMSYSLL